MLSKFWSPFGGSSRRPFFNGGPWNINQSSWKGMEGDGSSLGNSLLSHWYPVISQYHWVKSLTSQFWWLNHVESQFQITSFWWWNRPLFNAKSFFFHEQILIFYRLNHIVFGCFKHICLWFSLSHHFSWGKSSLLKLQRLLSPASAGFVLLQPMAGKCLRHGLGARLGNWGSILGNL